MRLSVCLLSAVSAPLCSAALNEEEAVAGERGGVRRDRPSRDDTTTPTSRVFCLGWPKCVRRDARVHASVRDVMSLRPNLTVPSSSLSQSRPFLVFPTWRATSERAAASSSSMIVFLRRSERRRRRRRRRRRARPPGRRPRRPRDA